MLTEFDIDKIVNYLERHKGDLERLYSWNANTTNLDKIIKLSDKEKNNLQNCSPFFEKEILLKGLVNQRLKEYRNNNKDLFEELALWIIKDWGGITTGKIELTKTLIGDFMQDGFSLKFDRIASLSKLASFLDPENYIIYDSRVAYSLNWIILSEKAGKKYFPVPEGRNSKMMALDISVLIRLDHIEKYIITTDEELKHKLFINNRDKDVFIDKKKAYNLLNLLIKEVNIKLWKNDLDKSQKLFYTEMLLFSLADSEIYKEITNWCLHRKNYKPA